MLKGLGACATLLLFVLSAHAQAADAQAPESPRPVALKGALGADGARPLRLTAEIVESHQCVGEGPGIFYFITLRLRYTNAGAGRLFVYQGKNLFYQTRVRGAGGEGYEVLVTNSRFNDAEAEELGGRRPGRAFVTLRPGGTHETVVKLGFGVTLAGGGRVPNTLAPGEHTLQVVTSSWYESRRLGEELRERWRGAGLLWIDPLAAPPVAFTVFGGVPAYYCSAWEGQSP